MFVPSFARSVLTAGLIFLVRTVPAHSEIIYDNSAEGGTSVYYSLNEYGDEVSLGGTSRTLTQFYFEYYGDFTTSGATARVRFYLNDGAQAPSGEPTPGTPLFDSGTFNLAAGYQTKIFSGLKIPVPEDFTWTVQFSGLNGGAGSEAGLMFRDPPSVGSSADEVWVRKNDLWQLYSWRSNPMANFAVRIVGADPTAVAIRRDGKKAIIEWAGLSILQVADTVGGPYQDLPNARNRFELTVSSAPMKFYRLRD